MLSQTDSRNGFHVDPWVHYLGSLVEHREGLWHRLGGWETRLLSDSLSDVKIEQPVYISGLARSGSTKLLEVLDWHPDVVTHRYRDFPLLHIPYLWNRFLDFVPRRSSGLTERAHRDGILVDADSPEAFEEVLWMSFFPELHDPAQSSVLDGATENHQFETFYRDHIRKLLLVRSGNRYVCKGNYNITRLEYLLKIFPSARIVIPVRDPVWHIASLMKQHDLFSRAQQDNPRAVSHLRRAGHFEFGLDRRPINTGDTDEVREILLLWERGREVEAWARYWNHIHAYIADRLERNPSLAGACMLVRYEELCREPAATVHAVLKHCRLSAPEGILYRAAESIRFPGYYRPQFPEREMAIIRRCTGGTAARLALGSSAGPPAESGERRWLSVADTAPGALAAGSGRAC